MLVEGERLRPRLDHLLSLANYVTMSASFPKVSATQGGSHNGSRCRV